MSTHTALRSVDKVISELLIEAKLKGPLQVNIIIIYYYYSALQCPALKV